jgi:hypothetical protein
VSHIAVLARAQHDELVSRHGTLVHRCALTVTCRVPGGAHLFFAPISATRGKAAYVQREICRDIMEAVSAPGHSEMGLALTIVLHPVWLRLHRRLFYRAQRDAS